MRNVLAVLLAAALAQPVLSAKEFSVAVIPDTQVYSNRYAQKSWWWYPLNQMDFMESQIDYLIENSVQNGGFISMALFEGDLVENRGRIPYEWRHISDAIYRLSGALPYMVVPGNHDCDKWTTRDKTIPTQCSGWDTFRRCFGSESRHFKDAPWYGGSSGGGTSSWSLLSQGGTQILFLCLELEPTDEAIAWATSVLRLHEGVPTVIVTHEYLTVEPDPEMPQYKRLCDSQSRLSEGGHSPQYLWENLIRSNAQIFMVLCGHAFDFDGNGEGIRVEKNDAGFPVYALLANYQYRKETIRKISTKRYTYPSGDGWLRLLGFDIEHNAVHVRTYSPYLGRYETDGDSEFTIELGFDWSTRFPRTDTRPLSEAILRTMPVSSPRAGLPGR